MPPPATLRTMLCVCGSRYVTWQPHIDRYKWPATCRVLWSISNVFERVLFGGCHDTTFATVAILRSWQCHLLVIFLVFQSVEFLTYFMITDGWFSKENNCICLRALSSLGCYITSASQRGTIIWASPTKRFQRTMLTILEHRSGVKMRSYIFFCKIQN